MTIGRAKEVEKLTYIIFKELENANLTTQEANYLLQRLQEKVYENSIIKAKKED